MKNCCKRKTCLSLYVYTEKRARGKRFKLHREIFSLDIRVSGWREMSSPRTCFQWVANRLSPPPEFFIAEYISGYVKKL